MCVCVCVCVCVVVVVVVVVVVAVVAIVAVVVVVVLFRVVLYGIFLQAQRNTTVKKRRTNKAETNIGATVQIQRHKLFNVPYPILTTSLHSLPSHHYHHHHQLR